MEKQKCSTPGCDKKATKKGTCMGCAIKAGQERKRQAEATRPPMDVGPRVREFSADDPEPPPTSYGPLLTMDAEREIVKREHALFALREIFSKLAVARHHERPARDLVAAGLRGAPINFQENTRRCPPGAVPPTSTRPARWTVYAPA